MKSISTNQKRTLFSSINLYTCPYKKLPCFFAGFTKFFNFNKLSCSINLARVCLVMVMRNVDVNIIVFLPWLNNIIQITPLGCKQGCCKPFLILFLHRCLVWMISEYDFHCTTCSHDSNFSRWPCNTKEANKNNKQYASNYTYL